MVRLQKLTKAYDKPVFTDFSFDFPQRGLVLIRGASGCGKTTLLRILAGLEKPDRGQVIGMEGLRVSCVFQEARLVPHMSLLKNVMLVDENKTKSQALACLARVGLAQDAHKHPRALSGGMKLRGAVARSLFYGGDVYLWDEPTKELDPHNRSILTQILHELSQTALVIVVTHDPLLESEIEICL